MALRIPDVSLLAFTDIIPGFVLWTVHRLVEKGSCDNALRNIKLRQKVLCGGYFLPKPRGFF